jgi:hypothetical protein
MVCVYGENARRVLESSAYALELLLRNTDAEPAGHAYRGPPFDRASRQRARTIL